MIRFSFLAILAACEPVKSTPIDSSLGDTSSSKETGEGEGEAADTNSEETAAETGDTGASPSCEGVEVVGVVAYELGTEVYSLVVANDIVYVSRPADGELGTGVVDGWSLAQFEAGLLEPDFDAPDVEVVGDGARQYLSVTLFEDDSSGLVCGQTYGEEEAGRLLCWPTGVSGVASDIAELDVSGETPGGYFGYGVDAPGDGVYTWDASPPGRTAFVDGAGAVDLPVAACGGLWTYCGDGQLLDDLLVTSSDWGAIYAHDVATGAEVWSENTLSTSWAPTNLDRWGAKAVLFGAPMAGDEGLARVYDEDGLVSTDTVFVSSVTSGDDTDGRGYIAYHRWSLRDDGSAGELYVFTERTGEMRANYSYPELLGVLVGIEDPSDWYEPYVILEDVGHDGLMAFAVRGGRYVGLLRVCGE